MTHNNDRPYFKLYALYAENFETALNVLDAELKRSSRLTNMVYAEAARPEFLKLRLESLLILPIQRIPRYELLLRSLLQATSPKSDEHQQLKDVAEMVSDTNTHINEHVRRRNTADKVVMLQRRLIGGEGKLVAPGRSLVKEGFLYKICTDSQVRIRRCYLCSDTFVYAKRGSYNQRGSFAYRKSVELHRTAVHRAHVRDARMLVFQLSFRDGCPPLTFYAETPEETSAWYDEIRNTILSAVANQKALVQRGKVTEDAAATTATTSRALVNGNSEHVHAVVLHRRSDADVVVRGANLKSSRGVGRHRRSSTQMNESSLCCIL